MKRLKNFYDDSISSAVDHKFQNKEALSCKKAGHFSLEVGQYDIALSLFLQSHNKYDSWGDQGKAASLCQFILKEFINTSMGRQVELNS